MASADPRLPADVIDHAQLAMNYLDAFGDEIYSRYAETEWPEAVILDASPQREKDIKESGAKKQGGKRVFAILGAYAWGSETPIPITRRGHGTRG